MDEQRKQWNQRQKELRRLLADCTEMEETRQLLLTQHAWVHQADISGLNVPTFADEIWEYTEAELRSIPPGEEHSSIWCLFHLARIEDATMSVLAARTRQVFDQGSWQSALNSPIRHTANSMTDEEFDQMSQQINVEALAGYRKAVGQNTRQIILKLTVDDLERRVDSADIQRLRENGDVVPQARSILDYWGRRTMAGLLLMPATRHNLIHLNEARKVAGKATQ